LKAQIKRKIENLAGNVAGFLMFILCDAALLVMNRKILTVHKLASTVNPSFGIIFCMPASIKVL
jgi:hypothetical protein